MTKHTIKVKTKLKVINSGGGGNSGSTNEGNIEVKGGEKKSKQGTTNVGSKDYFHKQK